MRCKDMVKESCPSDDVSLEEGTSYNRTCTFNNSNSRHHRRDPCDDLSDQPTQPFKRYKSSHTSEANLYNLTLKSQLETPVKYNRIIPSECEQSVYRKSLSSTTKNIFSQNTGLPLSSSPAPIRKSGSCFNFDTSINSVNAIKRTLFEKDSQDDVKSYPPVSNTINSLLGNFEESILNGRLEPVNTVYGFTGEICASGSFCPSHLKTDATVFFYSIHDNDRVTSPYLARINLGKKGYRVPVKGTAQVTLFNPHGTVVNMFIVPYDLDDMPVNCQTFIRQRILYMPSDACENDPGSRKWLRYLIHLRFASSKTGRIYLHTDIRIIVFHKSYLDAAIISGEQPYELRSFIQVPDEPQYSPRT